jgi:hypothetical protein
MHVSNLTDIIKAKMRVFAKRHQVRAARIAPGLKAATHIVILVVRNDAERIPYLLQFYRKAGFQQFIVIDNESDDSGPADLAMVSDVSLFISRGSFKSARFGMD